MGHFLGSTPRSAPGRSRAERQPGRRPTGQGTGRAESKPKVVVEDSLYGNHVFLAVFLLIQNTFALVRMRSTNVLYEQPASQSQANGERPRNMAPSSSSPALLVQPTVKKTFQLASQTIRSQAWKGLHLKKLPELIVMMLRVEFLKADGTPRYKQPMWLLWTGQPMCPCRNCARCTCGASPSSICSAF
jgi:hypothetical protein